MRTLADIELNDAVSVRIEVPRWSHRKVNANGELDFVSPIPCLMNYGSVLGSISDDGDPLDALMIGPSLEAGHIVTTRVQGIIRFIDAGVHDPKLVCADRPLTVAERKYIATYVRVYTRIKRVVHRLRGIAGVTQFQGWDAYTRDTTTARPATRDARAHGVS